MNHFLSSDLFERTILLFLALPTVPIAVCWYRLSRLRATGIHVKSTALLVLALVTCSQALLLLGLISSDIVGPDYSSRRYATIYINLSVVALGTVVAAVAGRGVRGTLVASCAWVSVSWFYVAVVSSVV